MVEPSLLRLEQPIEVKPSDLIEEKTGKPIGAITENLMMQPNLNSCETTCVTDILHILALQIPDSKLKLSLKKVNRICGYRNPNGVPIGKLVPNLKKGLGPLGYNALEKANASRNNLVRVIKDKGCSFPLVGLSHEYMRDERDYRGDNDSDHAVVMLRCSDAITIIYDPYEAVSPAMKRKNEGYGRGVVAMHTWKFLDYWRLSSVSRNWMFWIERATVKSETLDSQSNLNGNLVRKK